MCPADVERISRVLPVTAAAMHISGCKRPLLLAVHDPAADAEQRAKRARPASYAGSKKPHAHALVMYDPAAAAQRATAGALVPYAYAAPRIGGEPIDAVPLAAAAPVRVRARAEPWWLRTRLLPHLRLRFDLPVHFIAEKAVTFTDLDPHQNRFRLPTDGVVGNLRPILSRDELVAANLHDGAMGPKKHRATEEELQGRKKRKGKKHGGLSVHVINEHHDEAKELEMSRWESSHGSVLKGEGYIKFINQCGFKQGDMVEIWAFVERHFPLFGVTMCKESPLYLVIIKQKE